MEDICTESRGRQTERNLALIEKDENEDVSKKMSHEESKKAMKAVFDTNKSPKIAL